MIKVLTRDYIHNLYMDYNTHEIIVIDDNGYSITINNNTDSYLYPVILDFIHNSKPVVKSFRYDHKTVIIGVNKISF